MPANEEKMNYKEALIGMAYIMKHYCRTASAVDEVAKEALLTEIEKVIPYADDLYTRYQVFEQLEDLLLSLRIFQSNPKPGSSPCFFLSFGTLSFPGLCLYCRTG